MSIASVSEAFGDDPEGAAAFRTPPADNDAERSVLGAMLISRDAIDDVWDTISGRDFYHPKHEVIYDAIVRRYGRLEPVDVLLITDDLRASRNLDRIGGPAYLHELVASVPFAANAGYYAEVVRDTSARRRIIAAGTRIAAAGFTPGEADAATLLDFAIAEVEAARHVIPGLDADATNRGPWSPLDLTTILAEGEDMEQPTVLRRSDGMCLLYPAAVHAVAGEPETGKSWLGMIGTEQEIAVAHDVLYVDFEDRAGRVVARLLDLGCRPEDIADHFHYVRPDAALDAGSARRLLDIARGCTFAVIDGVTEAMTMHGLDPNVNADAAKFLALLPRRIADAGPAVLQIDHVVKDSDRQGRWAVGAGHKLAGLDGAQYGIKIIDPFARGKAGKARITVSKDRPGSVREAANGHTVAELVIDATGPNLVASLEAPVVSRGPDGDLRPTHLMEKVSRYIEDNPEVTARDVLANVSGKADYLRKAIKFLIIEGFVTTEPGPRGAVHHRSDNPFRESDHS